MNPLTPNRHATPALPSSPPAQHTSLPAAQTSNHAGPSNASVSAHPVRSSHSNLRRFLAGLNYFGGESGNIDASTPEGIEQYKSSVHAWVTGARDRDEVPRRRETEARINAWLGENNPEALLDLTGCGFKDFPPLPSTLQHLKAHRTQAKELPKNLPSGLISLDLDGAKIRHLPKNLPDTLASLNISRTEIAQLPKNLPSGLISLDLQGAKIKHLPKNLPDTLASLNITRTEIAQLPASLPSRLTLLDISHTQITELPSLPSGLTSLNASFTPITHLPNLPSGLTSLNAHSTPIAHLPNLPSGLTSLDVGRTEIAHLPSLPSGLTFLDVVGTEIAHLPNLPSGLTSLNVSATRIPPLQNLPSGLTHLNISHNQITELPSLPSGLTSLNASRTRITHLPSLPSGLTRLDINGNDITELPSLPSGLTYLDIGDNPITELPSLPSGLTYLNISYSRIDSIPDHLLQAMRRPINPCRISSWGLPNIRQQIDSYFNRFIDAGPTLVIGARNRYGVGRSSPTLWQAVQAWYGAPDANRQAAWEKIHQEAQTDTDTDPTASLWALLDSLSNTAEHPSEAGDGEDTKAAREAMRAAFKPRVTHLLDEIQENKPLRIECFEIASEHVATCGDNVTLGFAKMELAHLKTRAAEGQFAQQELAQLGVGTFKLALLDELAAKKARLSGNDRESVEVVLAYRIKLADELDLPTQTKAMLYPRTANITDDDLEAARKAVEEKVNPASIASFLVDWEPWQKDLERLHPKEFDAAAVERGKDLLFARMEALNAAYGDYVEQQGEDSPAALETKTQMNALNAKFNTLEQDLFRDARERLTNAFVSAQFTTSS